tara:strand:+ start:226 stop:498 length:273 start_codon:yes stop_codon:yes gene_type:complete
MTVTEIQQAILRRQFTDRELRDINGVIVDILKEERRHKVAVAKSKLRVGMEVTFQGRQGKIVKINRTKCVVDVGGHRGRWNVPMTMCQAV